MNKIIICAVLFVLLTAAEPGVSASPYREHVITDGVTVIEAEHFDAGGFHGENGNSEPPRKETAGNAARDGAPYPNFNIGYINAGEFLRFTVRVETDGHYKFQAWLASGNEFMPGGIDIIILGAGMGTAADGRRVGFAEPSQEHGAGWQTWYLETAGSVNLTAGTHVVKTAFPDGAVNFDALIITRLGDMIEEEEETESGTESEQEAEKIIRDEALPGNAEPGPADSGGGQSGMGLWAGAAVAALALMALIITAAVKKKV